MKFTELKPGQRLLLKNKEKLRSTEQFTLIPFNPTQFYEAIVTVLENDIEKQQFFIRFDELRIGKISYNVVEKIIPKS